MTNEEAIAIIRKEYLCVDRDCDIERNCGKCDLAMPSKEPILKAFKMAMQALETIPKYKDAYNKGWCDGAWAVYEHLKMCEEEQEQSGDLISRQAVIDIIHLFFTEEVNKIPTKKTEDGEVLVIHKCQPLFAMNKAICKRIKALPSVPTVQAIPIPDNATNGDVIKAMFPCLEKYEYDEPYTHGIALAGNDNRVTWFANDWWYAPYKGSDKE